MTRVLNTATLNQAAKDLAGHWFLPSMFSKKSPEVAISGRDWVIQSFYNSTYKDEFEHLIKAFRGQLGPDAIAEFDKIVHERYSDFGKRDEALFAQLLEEKLAVRPDGTKIKGKVGTTNIGELIVGWEEVEVEPFHSIRRRKMLGLGKEHRETVKKLVPKKQPVFVGQEELFGVGALVTNISAEIAILGLDALLDGLDEGTGAAVIQGRSGVQPADPDAVTTGTLLFTLTCTDPAFLGATDQANGTVRASASAITDDSSADATATLGYCRASATNDGATPLDDHIDGEAGTSGADFNFNTVSIVTGATISMTSWTVTLPQGSTAT